MSEKLIAKTLGRKPDKNIIVPTGPRLNLVPVFDRFFVSDPDKGDDVSMIGGIHLPGNTTVGRDYAEVVVGPCGPDVKTVLNGQRVIVLRPQVSMFAHMGQKYYWTTEAAVMGIIS